MKFKSTLPIVALGAALIFTLLGNSGGAPAGRTGAPGDSTCATVGCHSGELNQGNATIELNLADDAATYQPGAVNTINISISDPQNANKNGFEILALDQAGNNFGTWELPNPDQTQIRSGSNMRQYVTHTNQGNSQTSWQVNWVAPENAMDTLVLYLAVNDANNNGSNSGDNIYTTSLTVAPDTEATSIKILDAATVKIFPNPVVDVINIQSTEYTLETFAIYDLNGRQLMHGAVQSQIDLSKLDLGLYTLQFNTPEGQLIKKIQKL